MLKILGKKFTSEEELASDITRRDTIYEKIAMAKTTLQQAHDARNNLLTAGDLDDAAIARADTACRAAQDHLEGLETAVASITDKISQTQVRIAEDKASAAREAAAVKRSMAVESYAITMANPGSGCRISELVGQEVMDPSAGSRMPRAPAAGRPARAFSLPTLAPPTALALCASPPAAGETLRVR